MTLNGLQRRIVAAALSGHRRVAIRAGWGSGKTCSLVLLAMLIAEQGGQVLFVTDTGPRMGSVVMPVCEDILLPNGWVFFGEASKRYWQKGSARIWLRSYFRPGTRDATSNPIEGIDASAIIIDEGQSFRDGNELLKKVFGRSRRKSATPPIIVTAGLPVYGAWWEEDAARAGPAGCIIHGTSYDNRANLAPLWFADALRTLGRREFDAMLLNRPRPPEGQIYDCWDSDPYPVGNVVRGWSWRPTMRTVLAMDFGLLRPSILVLAQDPALQAWVICAEIHPKRPKTQIHQLCLDALGVVWPRHYAAEAPPGSILFDGVVADPAGKAISDHDGKSSLQLVSLLPPGVPGAGASCGLGVYPRVETDPSRKDVMAGITRTRRVIELRHILCTSEVWEAGLRGPPGERSLARAIAGYRTDAHGRPIKGEGYDDVMDCLRYFVREHLWWAAGSGHPLFGGGGSAVVKPGAEPVYAAEGLDWSADR